MLEVVIDTSALIPLLANKRINKKFLFLIKNGKIIVYICKEILKEINLVLRYPKIYTLLRKIGLRPENILFLILNNFKLKELRKKMDIIKEDPSDNIFISLAIQEDVDYLVSRDCHLLNLKRVNNIRIISLREFIEIIENL